MSTSNPIVSVIILTYNQEKSIGQTIDSILSQKTDYIFEVIIGEDASPSDNTRAICESYATRYPDIIHLMPKAPNKGLLQNYIDCLAIVRGKYIACCAGDDWWNNPEKLQIQIDFLEANHDYGVIHTDYDLCNQVDDTLTKSFNTSNKRAIPSGDVYANLLRENFIVAGTTIIRKSTFDSSVDLKKYSELGFMMEDYPMWLAISQVSKFKYLDISTFSYTFANGSLSNSGSDIERAKRFEENVMSIRRYFLNKCPVIGFSERDIRYLYHVSLFSFFVRGNQMRLAREYGWKMVKFSPNVKNIVKLMICYIPALFYKYHRRFAGE